MERVVLSEEMNKIRREIAVMAARVEEDFGKALAVLRSGGEELAEEIKESGKIVDTLQLKIEDMAMVLIATQQPVARDLRELITVFKITANLERIGDHGIHLVKAALRLSKQPPFRSVERIERMVETAVLMLKEAISAYLSQDPQAARKAAALDDKIDQEHKALTDEALAFIREQPHSVKAAARLLRLSGNMERLGDHITNICEGIIYMIEGSHEELNA
ncbi:MAG: phosphate signaling complex protein PhoU [Treponema sp.]|jgi:phosphate transport system protein|nr:phosphate signaling complex protein PhoU [Treponema sp.]